MSKALAVQQDQAHNAPQRREPVSLELREEIIMASVEGKKQAEIAEEFGRSVHTIRTVLRSEHGRRRTEELPDEFRDAAVRKLRAMAERAVDSWIRQLDLADEGKRANHLPAKDLLTHTGVLDIPSPKKDEKPQITIQIGGSTDDIVFDTVEAEETDEPERARLPARVIHKLLDDDPTA